MSTAQAKAKAPAKQTAEGMSSRMYLLPALTVSAEVQVTSMRLTSELQALAMKIAELENEADEHKSGHRLP